MGWSKLAAAIGEFGFPVIMALGMGYFIWYVWKVITIDIKPALGKLFASSIKLTDQQKRILNKGPEHNEGMIYGTMYNDWKTRKGYND